MAFRWPVRIYWEDTDAGGIVFYANYLKFFERARTEWLRAAGVSQQELIRTLGAMFVVAHTEVDYHAPAQLDDELKLSVVVQRLGRASVDFVQHAWRIQEGEPALLATGRIRVACVDAATFKPRPIPQPVLTCIRKTG